MRAWLAGALALWSAAAHAEVITSARYDGPTTRYPHGVLGDTIEHDTLTVTLSDGTRTAVRYEATIVFEDTAPRLADVNGDGKPEVVVVESHRDKGARLVVWGLEDGMLRQIARTPFIGTRFRWLAPVGIADLDDDGAVEIAYVDRPHLAKTLRLWRFGKDGLREVATMGGVTNHRIGEDYISGGLRDCGQGPEMIVASADWSQIMAVTFDGERLSPRPVARMAGRDSFADVVACQR